MSTAADRFIELYNEGKKEQVRCAAMMLDAKEQVGQLRGRMQRWNVPLAEALGAEADFSAPNRVPDDVLNDAERMLALVAAAQQEGKIQNGAELIADLTPVFQSASTKWADTLAAYATRPQHAAEVVAAGNAFNKQLIVLRRALRMTLGSRARDYRALKTGDVIADREEADTEPDATEAASPSSTAPGEPAASNGITATNGRSTPVAA